MNHELKRIWKEAIGVLSDITQNLHEETEEQHGKT
jgi:hypothetical protein